MTNRSSIVMTAISLPSIKISKTSPSGKPEPVTPISDVESPIVSENEKADGKPSGSPKSPQPASFNNLSSLKADAERSHSPSKALGKRTSTADPVTLQILRRTTGSSNTSAKQIRHEDEPERPGTASSERRVKAAEGSPRNGSTQASGKDKKKGVSFLSRIMGGTKKRDMGEGGGSEDGDSVDGDLRLEGMDAAVFSQPIGYTPKFPAPPKYIRVHSHHKPRRDFNQIFLAQELSTLDNHTSDDAPRSATVNGSLVSLALPGHKSGAIWAMKFSKDGKFLAAAGQDRVVRVWQVLGCKEDRAAHEQDEDAAGRDSAHVGDGNGMRLNAPVFRSEPVREYYGHTGDILDLSWSKNNFLLSSSMDKTVRLWHVTRKECLCCFQHSDFVTSIAFHPKDDRFFLAGSLDSKLRLWSIPDKSVAYWNELPDLITAVAFSPDGRMVIAGCLNGLCLFYETEGLKYNTQLHVRSSHGRNAKGSKITGIEAVNFPPDDPNGEVKILITSNDSRVRIYNARDKSLETKFKGYENTSSQIHATFSDDTKYIISGSEDRKVYIWNTAPGESDRKDKRPLEFFEAHPVIVTVAIMAPKQTRQLLSGSDDPIYDLCNPPPVTLISRSDSLTSKQTPLTAKAAASATGDDDDSSILAEPRELLRAEDKPSWVARSGHPGGNIIVTADYRGRIKVFRQDCAASKRRNDTWETSSAFSKKIGGGILRKTSTSTQPSPDRIMNWRASVSSLPSADGHSLRGSIRAGSTITADSPRDRSASPRKSVSVASSLNNTPVTNRFGRSVGNLRSRSRAASVSTQQEPERKDTGSATSTPVEGIPSMAEGLGNSPFDDGKNVSPLDPGRKKFTLPLSSEDEEEEEEEEEDTSSEGDTVRCKKCTSSQFKAKVTRKGEKKLVCVKCNTVV